MKIITTNTATAARALAKIPELGGESAQSLDDRIQQREQLCLVAESEQGALLGVKIGYALDAETFYSWLGGVTPLARGQGVAQALLDEQEAWACRRGYQRLTVKSRNRFAAMLRLLLRNGYQVDGFEAKDDIENYRLHFTKNLHMSHK